jgi:protein-disulfide isomerase
VKKTTLAILAALLAGASSPLAARAQGSPAPAQVEDPKAVYRVPVDDSALRGPPDALVTIVEFSDFECPYSKRASPTLKQIETAYTGKVRFVFKHNPLPMHASAVPAALVAEVARAQGGDARFWAVHDRFFDIPAVDRAAVEAEAQALGLSGAELGQKLNDSRALERIHRDQALARSLGASGTPTFFVNGRKVVGAQPFESFRVVIDEELKRAGVQVGAGVASKDLYAKIMEGAVTAPVMMAAPAAAAPHAQAAKVPVRRDDPAKGPKRARITVVEFSDFQCPFCSRALPAVADVKRKHAKDVRLVWKHLPLPFHPNAMPAALVAEAARQQGKFWEMHDRLFASQASLTEASYEQLAREIGLDLPAFRTARAAPATRQRVEEDVAAAAAAGVNGTPTFVVNGEPVVGAAALGDAVERHLKKAQLAGR